jgi:hypothetical protein
MTATLIISVTEGETVSVQAVTENKQATTLEAETVKAIWEAIYESIIQIREKDKLN